MPPAERRYDIDALRVIAFGLLVLYHVGLVYVSDWGYHLKSLHRAEWLEWPMLLLNRWRMPLLFLMSGAALGFARPWDHALRALGVRSRRLLVPLFVGMLLIVPIQPYVELLSKGLVEPGYWTFLAAYLGGSPWPEDAFGGSDYGITWNHLWFLPYVWFYGVVAIATARFWSSTLGAALIAGFHRAPTLVLWMGLWLPALLAMFFLSEHWPDKKDFFPDLFNHARYGAIFAFGLLLGQGQGAWLTLERARWTLLPVAVVFGLIYFPWLQSVDGLVGMGELLALQALRCAYTVSVLLSVLAWGKHLLNRPWPGLAYANDAVLSWYVLHQSLIIPLSFLASHWHLGPAADVALVLGGTLVGCLLLHECLIRRWRPMRWLFGLRRRAATSP